MLPMQPGDVPATFADVADLEREVGFKPCDLDRGGAGEVRDVVSARMERVSQTLIDLHLRQEAAPRGISHRAGAPCGPYAVPTALLNRSRPRNCHPGRASEAAGPVPGATVAAPRGRRRRRRAGIGRGAAARGQQKAQRDRADRFRVHRRQLLDGSSGRSFGRSAPEGIPSAQPGNCPRRWLRAFR